MLAVTLLLSLTAFSQKDTNKEQNVCMPLSVAQKVAVDLIRLDSVTVELKNTQVVLQKTEQKLTEQDSLVLIYKEKLSTYQQEIATQNIRFNTCSERVTKLEKDVVTLTDKNKRLKGWLKGIGGGFVTSVGLLIAMIAIK